MVSIFENNFIKKLNNNWIFEYIMIMLYILFSVLGWLYSYSYAGIGIVSLTIVLLFIFNDFKYVIPAGLCVIFSYNGGYESSTFPIEIACYGGVLIFIILLYSILNFKKSNFKRPKSYIGIMLLAISCMIPIFWNKIITQETQLMYFIYFSWVLYIVVYFVFGINLGKNSLRVVIFTFSAIAVLLFAECFLTVYRFHINNPDIPLLMSTFSLGWGICNEAGILFCFCMPFVFYQLVKTKNSIISAICTISVAMCMAGIVLTTSRGAMLFGGCEFIALCVLMVIFSKKKITNIVFMLLMVALGLAFIQIYFGIPEFINDLIYSFKAVKLSDDERWTHYSDAISSWNTDWLTRIFGSGIVSKIETRWSLGIYDSVFIVYHSTFFETLVMGGIVGILALAFHFFEKYKQLWKSEKAFFLVMIFGYLFVDLYGMIDNTYGMYYYMVPLVILMASLDNDKNTDIFNYELIGA